MGSHQREDLASALIKAPPEEPRQPLEPSVPSYLPEPKVKFPGDGLLHLMSFESDGRREFAVMWAPFHTPGGAVPSRRFANESDLKNFLLKELKIKDRWVKRAMNELASSRSAELQISLSREEARLLGLLGVDLGDSVVRR